MVRFRARAGEPVESASARSECAGFRNRSIDRRRRKFVHFAWATDFSGFFLSELQAKVEAPSTDSVMLFDCWTPAAVLGQGYYAQAVELIAQTIVERGRQPWIFSAAGNVASLRGLEKSGFRRRYSLVRQRLLGWQRIKGHTPKSQPTASDSIPAASEDSAA